MQINKKDLKSLSKNILLKAYEVLNTKDIYSVSSPLNIDKDLRSIRLNSQYRLLYRQSTKKECRVVTHNDYNRLIKFNSINSIN
jgi:plasmid maintenance system killer protein